MMRRWLAFGMALCVLYGCAAPGSGQESGAEPTAPRTAQSASAAPLEPPRARRVRMRCRFYEADARLVNGAIAAPAIYEAEGFVRAGLVPHHLLASDMIAGFFALAAQQKERYDTVLLLSPSHFPENCKSDAVTADAGWDTPFGSVEPDSELVERILQNGKIGAEHNPAAVEADHGAGGLVPFIRQYLPDAKLAVLLLSNRLSRERLEAVWALIGELQENERVLVVASSDCSHYLMPAQAAAHDAQTAEAIEAFQFERILSFSDQNTDSPQALTSFLTAAQDSSLVQLDHAHSAEKLPFALGNPAFDEGVTSYFVYAALDRTD